MSSRTEPFTVSELTRSIKNLLESEFDQLLLQGEISGLSRPASGHLYFTVKDDRAQISGVMFKGAAARLGFDLENGQDLLLFGRIGLYEPRGSYQIIVDHAEPLGAGSLMIAFEQLKSKLEKEGLFDQERKKALPFLPKKIGLVTSATGAAVQDMIDILHRRLPMVSILINPVSVQGKTASREIARAIEQMQEQADLDLLIVGRGGGSIEDLWSFNEEPVVRAIAQSKLPVISAVGHETDFTLADFAADLRAPTPSGAAELAVPTLEALLERTELLDNRLRRFITQKVESLKEKRIQLTKRIKSPRQVLETQMMRTDELTNRLNRFMNKLLSFKRQNLEDLYRRFFLASPEKKVSIELARLEEVEQSLRHLMKSRIEAERKKIEDLTRLLESVGPESIMGRGYSITRDKNGRILRSVDQTTTGAEIITQLSDGQLESRVMETLKIKKQPAGNQHGQEHHTP